MKTKKKSKCRFDKKRICRALICRQGSFKCKARDSFGLPRYALPTHKIMLSKNDQIKAKAAVDSIKE